jgi:two-component system, NtrC family, sensor histidine kinase PilS
MTKVETRPTALPGSADTSTEPPWPVARWMLGLRVLAVSALLVGALLVQATTEDILPIAPLVKVAGLTYALSLLWIVLWQAHIPARLHGLLQLAGDVVIFAALIYLTGGPSSPFVFLFTIVVAMGALMFGLRGALATAGGAFMAFGVLSFAMMSKLLPWPASMTTAHPSSISSLAYQVLVTGAGLAVVGLLTSYLARSVQKAEARLEGERAASARLRALSADVLRSVDSGVLAADVDGRVVLANPAAQRVLGLQGPVAGMNLAELLPMEGVEWPEVVRRLDQRSPFRVEGGLRGSSLLLGCTVTALSDAEGTLLGLVIHFRDLTEARDATRRERLRERMEAVGEMAAGMAHEIGNPLASISGSAQILGKIPTLGESGKRLSRIIVEESRRLSGIIEAFLGYARPPDPLKGPCDIARTLDETLTLFKNSPEVTKDHKLVIEIQPHTSTVIADERQLRQAFYNLARNAIQAMPHGGTMQVEAKPEGGWYVIRWSDNGVGMEPQQIQEIFQPFRAFRKGGTGLGLAVVYSIVSDHHGDIQVDSRVGNGSVFTLRLPLEAV